MTSYFWKTVLQVNASWSTARLRSPEVVRSVWMSVDSSCLSPCCSVIRTSSGTMTVFLYFVLSVYPGYPDAPGTYSVSSLLKNSDLTSFALSLTVKASRQSLPSWSRNRNSRFCESFVRTHL